MVVSIPPVLVRTAKSASDEISNAVALVKTLAGPRRVFRIFHLAKELRSAQPQKAVHVASAAPSLPLVRIAVVLDRTNDDDDDDVDALLV